MNKLIYLFVVALLSACANHPNKTTESNQTIASNENIKNSSQSEKQASNEKHDSHNPHHVPGLWITNMDDAQQLAKKENKDILMFYTGSDWCSSCNFLIEDVFRKQQAQDYIKKHFVMVELDFPNDEDLISEEQMAHNLKWGEKYEADGYPMLLLTNSATKPYSSIIGYQGIGVEAFLQELEEARSNKRENYTMLESLKQLKGQAYTDMLHQYLSQSFTYLTAAQRREKTEELVELLPKGSQLYQAYKVQLDEGEYQEIIETIPLKERPGLEGNAFMQAIVEDFRAFRKNTPQLSETLLINTLQNEVVFIQNSGNHQLITEVVDDFILSDTRSTQLKQTIIADVVGSYSAITSKAEAEKLFNEVIALDPTTEIAKALIEEKAEILNPTE